MKQFNLYYRDVSISPSLLWFFYNEWFCFEKEVFEVIHSFMQKLLLRIILSPSKKASSSIKPSLLFRFTLTQTFYALFFCLRHSKQHGRNLGLPVSLLKKKWRGQRRLFTEHQLSAIHKVWSSRYHAEQNKHGFYFHGLVVQQKGESTINSKYLHLFKLFKAYEIISGGM